MDLMDETGEIRATAFKEQCDMYYDMIQVGLLDLILRVVGYYKTFTLKMYL